MAPAPDAPALPKETMETDLAAFARAMPKAELHMHLEGSLAPETLFRLAARNGIDLGHASPESLAASYEFANLQAFLDLYYQGLRVLVTEEDFYETTRDYLRLAAADNIVHTELYLSPQAHLRRGLPFELFLPPVLAALAEAREELGLTGGIICGIQRQWSEEEALDMLAGAKRFADDILGIGMGGPEIGNPPDKFQNAFARARSVGWMTTAHAGEEGGPETVAATLDLLLVDRIDHGVRAGEDPALVERLASAGVPLTVCPLSNVRLKVFPDLASHNLAQLLRAGVKVTVNSDDPPYFGGYLNENLVQCQQAFALSRDELVTLARNSLEAAIMPSEARKAALTRLAILSEA